MTTDNTDGKGKKKLADQFETQDQALMFAAHFDALPAVCIHCRGSLKTLLQTVTVQRVWRWDAEEHAYLLDVEETAQTPRCGKCGTEDKEFSVEALFPEIDGIVYVG